MEIKRALLGKKTLITGGTKGLGFATAQLLAELGSDVFLSYRSDDSGAKAAADSIRRLEVRCEVFPCDLADEGGVDRLFDSLAAQTPTLDFYIHNAAATSFKNLLEIQAHHIDKTMNITVKSFILGVNRAVQMMSSGGAVVAVSGMDTRKAVPLHGLLGAAKSALETLVAYYAHELASRKIRVNGVNPGFFESESTRKYLGPVFDSVQTQYNRINPMKRGASLKEIANVILFLCSEPSSWIVGQTLNVDGGFDFALPIKLN